MEGTLMIPPDRGSILGRASWKARYVTIASSHPGDTERFERTGSTTSLAARIRAPSRISTRLPTEEGLFLSVYKSKTEREAAIQIRLSQVTECRIQTLAHKKQGPALPTMVVTITPDPAADKLRKRRSSRAGGLLLPQGKETGPLALWFRAVSPDAQPVLQDWCRFIQSALQTELSGLPPTSPMSPTGLSSPMFAANPFAIADVFPPRPQSSNQHVRIPLHHKSSNHTQSSRDRPLTFSESLSLKSKRSDISSRTGSINTPNHKYSSTGPADLPSPAPSDYQHHTGLIEGWTSAQGRGSALTSPRESPTVRRIALPDTSSPVSAPPPPPRETILDRAFQMQYIPGSEKMIPGEEKLSSLARFEALMREADGKRDWRQQREVAAAATVPLPRTADGDDGMKSAWDLDDSEQEEEEGEENGEGEDEDAEYRSPGQLSRGRDDSILEEDLQEDASALNHYTTGRINSPEPATYQAVKRTPLKYNAETLLALSSGPLPTPRSSSSQARLRPTASNTRSITAPDYLTTPGATTTSSSAATFDADDARRSNATLTRVASSNHHRHSGSSSTKRLSFQSFTKRLSTTSSLIIQGGTLGGGSGSGEGESSALGSGSRAGARSPLPSGGGILSSGAGGGGGGGGGDQSRKCGWRGSAGVFGGDGGFL